MYAVVGCRECHALWVVEGRPETTGCPRCRTRFQFAKLKTFAETDDASDAARVRSAILAKRADGEFVPPETVDVDAVGMSDDEFLEASGIDSGAVADAAERTTGAGRTRSRKQVVLDALSALDEPTEDAVRAYAAENGVPAAYTERALKKLTRAGELTETDGVYRQL